CSPITATAPTHTTPLSLHDALPISGERPRVLSLRLCRQRQGLCRRDGAGGADGHARGGRARSGWLSQGLLRQARRGVPDLRPVGDRKSTRLNSSHVSISYAVFCLKK